MRFRLTDKGRKFLVVLVVLGAASLTSQSSLLLLPVGILAGCFLVNAWTARREVASLRVEAPGATHLAEGHKLSQPWRVINDGDRLARFITAEAQQKPLFRLGAVAPGQTAHVVPEFVYLQRGVYPLETIALTSVAPFGLVSAARRLTLEGEVVVHPAIYQTECPVAAGFDVVVGGKYHGRRQTASGSLFAGVRPFQPGDPFKHIHWKSSAKGQDLMVKTFNEELSGRVAMIIDAGHTGDAKALDDCLRASGSLMFAALDEGHHAEWIDLASLEATLVPPFADGHEVLDALARVRAQRHCLTPERLHAALDKLSPRSAVCLIVTEENDAVAAFADELAGQRRKVAIYLPETGPLPDTQMDVHRFRFGARSIEPCA